MVVYKCQKCNKIVADHSTDVETKIWKHLKDDHPDIFQKEIDSSTLYICTKYFAELNDKNPLQCQIS